MAPIENVLASSPYKHWLIYWPQYFVLPNTYTHIHVRAVFDLSNWCATRTCAFMYTICREKTMSGFGLCSDRTMAVVTKAPGSLAIGKIARGCVQYEYIILVLYCSYTSIILLNITVVTVLYSFRNNRICSFNSTVRVHVEIQHMIQNYTPRRASHSELTVYCCLSSKWRQNWRHS